MTTKPKVLENLKRSWKKSRNLKSSKKYEAYPGISVAVGILQLGWIPSGKNICVKNVVALYYYAKIIFFCDEIRKNVFIHVINTVSNNLKDVLS